MNKVVLISGADGGIGQAITENLKNHGYKLSLGTLDPEKLEVQLGGETDQIQVCKLDAFDPDSSEAWISNAVEKFGKIEGLVNAIGIGSAVHITDDNDEDLDKVWQVNLKTPARLVRLCLPYLEACGEGRVVNIVSLGGKRIANVSMGYGVTKFAAMGLTHSIRTYGWDKGIRATALCPGWVNTPLVANSKTCKITKEEMTQPETVAHLVRTAIELPNNAAMAEMIVNCEFEDVF